MGAYFLFGLSQCLRRPRLLVPPAFSLLALLSLLLPLSGCVLPSGFSADLDDELDRAQRAPQNAPPPEPVLHSATPFIDPEPKAVPPAWAQRRIGEFSAESGRGSDLLHLVAAAAGVRAQLSLQDELVGGAFHFAGGTAAELAAAVVGQLGLVVQMLPDSLVFSDRQVRVFDLATFIDTDFDGNLSGERGSGSQGSGGAAAPSHGKQLQQVRQRIQLLAGEHAKVLLAPEQGVLTLSARPAAVRAVSRYVQSLNRELSQQVELDVRLVQIALASEAGIGLDWAAVKNRLSRDFSIEGAGKAVPTGLVISAGRSQTDAGEAVSALFSAFATQGRVRVLTNPRGVALNGRAIDIALVTQTAYLARILPSSVSVAGAAGEAGLEPDVVESGFVLRILPRVRGEQILLRLNARISTLRELSAVSSGAQSIQVPTLVESRFSHWARVSSGDTLVLGGVRELRSEQSFEAAPSRRDKRERSEQVLLVTPRLI